MKKYSRFFLLVAAAALLMACSLAGTFSGTINTTQAAPSATAPVLLSPEPTAAVVQPTLQYPELGEGWAAIMIQAPGRLSSVTSPIRINGAADSTFEQNLVIMVSGENGTPLAVQPTTIQSEMGTRGHFEAVVAFEVQSPQPGHISVYDISPKDGGLVSLESVPVMLYPEAEADDIRPQSAYPYPDMIRISFPEAMDTIQGGKLEVRVTYNGPFEGGAEAMLALVLCGEGGSGAPHQVCGTADNVLATGSAANVVTADPPGIFEGTLDYAVSGRVSGRLAVYVPSLRDGGIEYFTSVPVVLEP